MKKIYILLGNTDKETFSGTLADEYERGAKDAGHEVRRTNIGDIHFDPILHKGYKVIQELEPDLLKVQEDIGWADVLIFVYPNWWTTMPAILKGLFDRSFLPGFAFKFDKTSNKIFKLLTGKRARVIIVAGNNHPLLLRIKYGDFTNEIKRGILGFCGVSPVKITTFGPIEHCNDAKREGWKKDIYRLGKEGI